MRIVAAILAGGLGMRVRTVLPGLPKALAPMDGVPFISHLLGQVAEANVQRIVVCSGRRGEQLRRVLPRRRRSVPLLVSQEEWPLGTAGALRNALDYFDSDVVLAVSGDSYVDIRLAEFVEWYQSNAFASAALLVWSTNCAGHVTAEVDSTGRIVAFKGKGEVAEAGWIDSEVYLLPRAWIEALPADLPLSLERDALPYWVERGMGGYCTHAQYLDIGTPEGLAKGPSFFGSLRRKSSPRLAAGLYLV